MPYPHYLRARSHKRVVRTSGDIPFVGLYTDGFIAVDPGLDITLDALVGDVIEYGISGFVGSEGVDLMLDVGTYVSEAVVTRTGSTYGAMGWYSVGNVFRGLTGSVWHTLSAGDIFANTVTLRLLGGTGTAMARTIRASTDEPFTVFARNIGPADPN